MCGLLVSDGTVFINPARYIYIYIYNLTIKIKVYFVLKTNTIMMQKIDTMYFTSQII